MSKPRITSSRTRVRVVNEVMPGDIPVEFCKGLYLVFRRYFLHVQSLATGGELPARMREVDAELRALHAQAERQGGSGAPGPPGSRTMTFEEKRRLSMNLGNLPADKLGRVVEIISEASAAVRSTFEF